jgi:hypothetical protein
MRWTYISGDLLEHGWMLKFENIHRENKYENMYVNICIWIDGCEIIKEGNKW